jgi:hypothetical protein
MITFKEYIAESVEQELERRYAYMRKSELDGSGLETRGEKVKYSRAKTAFFKLLMQTYPEQTKMNLAYRDIADKYDNKR